MINHAGNTCSVGGTCLTFNPTSNEEMDLLEAFGFKFNKIHGSYSCYTNCSIERFIEIYKPLVVACQVAGVKHNLPLRSRYGDWDEKYHSEWKAREWDKALRGYE